MVERKKAPKFHWDEHTELKSWMFENDKGRPIREIMEDIKALFGIDLTYRQVSTFRSNNGLQTKAGGRPFAPRPIGSEIIRDGYVWVKITDDKEWWENWRPKSAIVWEETSGCALPEGHRVLFVDGDKMNLDPDNLVAASREQIVKLNQLKSKGTRYHNREELEALLVTIALDKAIIDAKNKPRPCMVCGALFVPEKFNRHNVQKTCRACVEAGKRDRWKNRKPKGRGTCSVCGEPFDKYFENQVRCSECSAKKQGKRKYEEWKRRRGL